MSEKLSSKKAKKKSSRKKEPVSPKAGDEDTRRRKLKAADEAINDWAGVETKPFPGITHHESRESKVENAMEQMFGKDWQRKDQVEARKIALSPRRSPSAAKPFPGIELHEA